MTLSLPAYGYQGIDIKPHLGIRSRRSKGGLVVTSRDADPYWRGTLVTGNLEISEHKAYQAFLMSAADTNRSIDFIHPRRRWPQAYATLAGYPGPTTGTATAFPDLRTATVSGLVIGTIYRPGDLVCFIQGETRVARWVDEAVTVSSITAQAIKLTPRLPLGVLAPNCTIRFIDPVVRARVVPDSWDTSEAYQPKPISFELMEALV